MRSSRWQHIADECFELVRRSCTVPDHLWDAVLEGTIAVHREWTEEEIAEFRRCDPEDSQELTRLLDDRQGRHVVKWIIFKAGIVPEALLVPTVRAGVRIADPSWNKQFIWPCVASHGRRRVLEILLDIAQRGSDQDKAGAANAWYWADVERFVCSAYYGPGHSLEEFGDPVDDLRDRWTAWVVGEFVRNPNVDVRRSLLPWLPASYEADPAALQRAMNIAAAHSDPYIRQRLAAQSGLSDAIPPLPRRAEQEDGER